MSAVTLPATPKLSIYSDQPTSPSSVVSFRNEKTRQPASACSVSILAMRMALLLLPSLRGAPELVEGATKRSRITRPALDCFASLAMTPLDSHDEFQRLAFEAARDVVADHLGEALTHHRPRRARHMRREDEVGRIP